MPLDADPYDDSTEEESLPARGGEVTDPSSGPAADDPTADTDGEPDSVEESLPARGGEVTDPSSGPATDAGSEPDSTDDTDFSDGGGGLSPEPGSAGGGYTPGPRTDQQPTAPQRDANIPDIQNYDNPAEYVQDATEQEFPGVSPGEISTVRTSGAVEPRFTERGARQAVASMLGVEPSTVTLGDPSEPSGYTVSDVQSVLREEASQLRQQQATQRQRYRDYQDVGQAIAAQAFQSELIEAGQNARRRQRQAHADLRRGNLGDPRDIIAEQVAAQKSQEYGFDVRPGDVVVERASGGYQVGLDRDIAEAGRITQEVQSSKYGDVNVTRTGENQFDVAIRGGYGNAQAAGSELESTLNEKVAEPAEQSAREQFDLDWSFGHFGPGDEVEQFVDTGVDIGRGITRATGELGTDIGGPAVGGLARGATAIATTPIQLPGIGLEAAEAGAAALRGPDQAQEVTHAGAQRVGQATSYYLNNPYEGGAVLAGSLLASYGATAAASRFAGSTGAAATRYAIQPGEELARAAGGRALGVGRASTDTATRRSSSSFTDRFDRPGPSIRIESDPEAPILDIDTNLKQQLQDYGVRIRDAPGRAGEAARARAAEVQTDVQDALSRVGEGVDTARQQYTRAELRAEALGYRTRVRTREALNQLAGLDPRAIGRQNVQELLDTARQQATRARPLAEDFAAEVQTGVQSGLSRVGQGIDTARQQYTRAHLRAGDFGYRTGVRTREAFGRFQSRVDTARQQYTRAHLRAGDFGYRTGVRTRETVDWIADLEPREGVSTLAAIPGAAAELPGQGFRAVRRSGVLELPDFQDTASDVIAGVGQRYTRANLRAEDLGYRTRVRTEEAVNRLLSAEMPDLSGRAQRELIAARFALRERGGRARETANRLSDLTIRIGDPEQPTIFDIDDPAAIRSPLGDELGIGDADAETTTRARDRGQDSDAAARSDDDAAGVQEGEDSVESGNQLLRQRTQTETEGQADATGRGRAETNRRRTTPYEIPGVAADTQGVALGGAAGTAFSLGLNVGARGQSDVASLLAEAQATNVGTGQRPRVFEREATVLDGRTDTRTETETRTGIRPRIRAASRTRTRTRAQTEGEDRGRIRRAIEGFGSEDDDFSLPGTPSDTPDGSTGVDDAVPGAGWLNVWATALAGGGFEARSDPENIDDLAAGALEVSLPTQGQVNPGSELEENLDAVNELLFLADEDNGGSYLGGLL